MECLLLFARWYAGPQASQVVLVVKNSLASAGDTDIFGGMDLSDSWCWLQYMCGNRVSAH